MKSPGFLKTKTISGLRRLAIAILLLLVVIGGPSLSLFVQPAPLVEASFRWKTARSYSYSVLRLELEAAQTALAAAKYALEQAKADMQSAAEAVQRATENVKAVEKVAREAAKLKLGEALVRLSAAALRVATCEAAVDAAAVAVKAALAALLAFTAGTLIGQGVDGLISMIWDPEYDLTPREVGDGPVYVAATTEETDALIPELILTATGLSLAKADFDDVGDAGAKSWEFMRQGVHIFIGAARGAAAFTTGREDEVLLAVSDLDHELRAYPVAIADFADVLANATIPSPIEDCAIQMEDYDLDVDAAKSLIYEVEDLLCPNLPDYTELIAQLDEAIDQLDVATSSVEKARTELAGVEFPRLIGSGGIIGDVTQQGFHEFLEDCANMGVSCLPPGEVALVDALLEASGVFCPTMPSFGPAMAYYIGLGDTDGRESAMFGPEGIMNVAELLARSVEESLATESPWLDINLYESPLVTASTSTSGGGCFIATAAYETPIAEEIEVLREFRDEYLLTNPVGQALVDFYYQISPPMAEFITEHPSLKPIVRAGLVPAVAMSTVAVNTTLAGKMAIVGLLLLFSLALAVWTTRRRGRGPKYS